MGFEDIREGLKVTRDALGPNVFVEKACCGQYFTYLSLADRVRTGDDIFGVVGDWQHLQTVARQIAANYMLHQRFWLNDPDAIFVGGASFFGGAKKVHNPGGQSVPLEPAILDEVRMRLQYHVSVGSFPTLGENMEDLDAERMRLLTLVLPSYGQSARPLDLFLHTTPEIYDLKVKTDWEQWHVLMLQNWDEWDKTYPMRFSALGLDKEKGYLVFSFWDQAFLGEFRGEVDLKVRMRQGETYAIREVPTHPWVLSTDLHLTQGGVELKGVRYEDSTERLEGEASRHAGAKGQVVIYVPQGYKIQSASGAYRVEDESSGAQVAHLQLEFERDHAVVAKVRTRQVNAGRNRQLAEPAENCGRSNRAEIQGEELCALMMRAAEELFHDDNFSQEGGKLSTYCCGCRGGGKRLFQSWGRRQDSADFRSKQRSADRGRSCPHDKCGLYPGYRPVESSNNRYL